MKNLARLEILIGILIVLISSIFIWDRFSPINQPVGQWTDAKQPKLLENIPKINISPKTVKVYNKSAKKKLNLPEKFLQDESQYVLSSTTLKHDWRPQTITTVLNGETGESTTITRREEYPWLAAENTGEIRVEYGTKFHGVPVGRLSIRQDFIQIKALHLGISASIDSDKEAFTGIGVSYKW